MAADMMRDQLAFSALDAVILSRRARVAYGVGVLALLLSGLFLPNIWHLLASAMMLGAAVLMRSLAPSLLVRRSHWFQSGIKPRIYVRAVFALAFVGAFSALATIVVRGHPVLALVSFVGAFVFLWFALDGIFKSQRIAFRHLTRLLLIWGSVGLGGEMIGGHHPVIITGLIVLALLASMAVFAAGATDRLKALRVRLSIVSVPVGITVAGFGEYVLEVL